jgi:Mn2+/Fe2+ NRAMP family transporter
MTFVEFSPVRALYWSAILNGLLAPFLLVGILLVASDKKIMAGQPSPWLGRAVVLVTTLAMLAAGAVMFVG